MANGFFFKWLQNDREATPSPRLAVQGYSGESLAAMLGFGVFASQVSCTQEQKMYTTIVTADTADASK
jgi:hypothetical protein